ncbi:transmembrane sensor/regulator PpyR [Pseudomonas mangiferae]|uniref:Transmembrane sensor/regulator PpyR n=1 Tax=Pseudomonas mangiferae TaxID=2593654 RepID=A0A553GZR7_9PSED|nr:transmembrane sensor/regulator PpyR [Pseudomonas mangiferae]TRX74987.1 transmembrane sensor/regulator PpyR [Pseudomonas mangiferae]
MNSLDLLECPQRALHLANRLLLSGAALGTGGLVAAYGLDTWLPIPALVLAHGLTVVGPGLLKIGYVMRLLSQARLRRFDGEVCCVEA